MTITETFNKSDIVVGNVTSIEEADVILLLENHESREDYEKIERIIHLYCKASRDLILLEQSKAKNQEELLNTESKRADWRLPLLKGKNVAGWDHRKSEQWVDEYYQNPDVIDFMKAVDVVENLQSFTDIKTISDSFLTLVRGFRHLERDSEALPQKDLDYLIKNTSQTSRKFKQLRIKLLDSGKEVLTRMEEVFISQTFPLRQSSLVKELKRHVPSIKARSGKIFVIMGRNHGHPFKSTQPAEVQKVINFLADTHHFVAI
jgi:hypothetical protein